MKQVPRYSNQRVGIFVDVQNLYHSAKNLYHGRVNYTELMKHLVAGRQLIRAMAYVVKSEGVEAQRPSYHLRTRASRSQEKSDISSEPPFFEALEKAGLEPRMKGLPIFAGGLERAAWDVGMGADGISAAR